MITKTINLYTEVNLEDDCTLSINASIENKIPTINLSINEGEYTVEELEKVTKAITAFVKRVKEESKN